MSYLMDDRGQLILDDEGQPIGFDDGSEVFVPQEMDDLQFTWETTYLLEAIHRLTLGLRAKQASVAAPDLMRVALSVMAKKIS